MEQENGSKQQTTLKKKKIIIIKEKKTDGAEQDVKLKQSSLLSFVSSKDKPARSALPPSLDRCIVLDDSDEQ